MHQQKAIEAACRIASDDGEFTLNSRGWNGRLVLTGERSSIAVYLDDGRPHLASTHDEAAVPAADDVEITATDEQWALMLSPVPPPPFGDPFGARFVGVMVVGDVATATRHLAVRRFVELVRHAVNGTDPSPVAARPARRHGSFDAAVGRYVHLDVNGIDHRVYFEEAGTGIALLCQHTAGADARQWRHVLEDERITSRFRVIAYDLPFHGRSLPPESVAWWTQPYLLTTATAMAVPLALMDVLGLDRPVFMGSSVGGMLALDLACFHADRFRAVIACEAALRLGPEVRKTPEEAALSFDLATDPALHAASMMSWMGTTAPERYRQETRLHYAQGAPGVFSGDINYFANEHDLRGRATEVGSETCSVHLLTGEYDFVTMQGSIAAAQQIPGATFAAMPGMGHFPMSEDPENFASHLLPLLDSIAAR